MSPQSGPPIQFIAFGAKAKCMQWTILQNISRPEEIYVENLPPKRSYPLVIHICAMPMLKTLCNCLFDTNSYLLGPPLRVSMVITSRRKKFSILTGLQFLTLCSQVVTWNLVGGQLNQIPLLSTIIWEPPDNRCCSYFLVYCWNGTTWEE